MIQFQDIGKLRTWLAAQSRDVVVAFAVRAALRVVPTLPGQAQLDHPPTRRQIEDAILLTFRALSSSWSWAAFPTRRKALVLPALSASTVLLSVTTVKFAACEAAASAALAVSAESDERSRFEAANAIGKASTALSVSGTVNYLIDAHSYDAAQIISGLSADKIAALPLWPSDKFTPWNFNSKWEELKRELHGFNPNWKVWTEWYEDRIIGQPTNEPLELIRATLSEEVWGRGTQAINAHINLLLAEADYLARADYRPSLDAVPQQIPRALLFGGDENLPISLIDPPGAGLLDNADQRQGFLDIRERAMLLDSICGASNRLAILKGFASSLLLAMGTSLIELRVRSYWTQMNSLRHRLEADVRTRASPDPESPPLPDGVSAALHDLVDALNVFAAHEPKLIALDELKRDPANRGVNAAILSATHTIAHSAAALPQAVNPKAADILVQVVSESDDNTPASERAKEFSAKSARNLVLECIRRAYKVVSAETGKAWNSARDGAYRAGGAGAAAYGAALLIKFNEAAVRLMIDTLGGSQTLHRIVDLIIKFF